MPSDANDSGAQRRKMYESISAPLEKISIKILLEFKLQEKVTSSVDSLVAAIVQLISEVDQSIEISPVKQGWLRSQDAMSKPGHFINALRRFPYAVDSGRITTNCAMLLKQYVDSGSRPESESHTVAFLLHDWAHAAYQYHLLKVNSKEGSKTKTTKPPITTAGPTKSRLDDPKRQVFRRPASGTLRSPPSSGSTTTSGPGSGRPGSSGGLRPGSGPSRKPNVGPTKFTINENSTRPTSDVGSSKKPNLSSNPCTSSNQQSQPRSPLLFDSTDGTRNVNHLSSEARRLALGGLPDWAIEIEQMKREVRELKSLDAKANWDLNRQETLAASTIKKQSEEELANWRTNQAREMKELEKCKEQEQKRIELEQNKDFLEFKKQRKKMERQKVSEIISEEYVKTKSEASWNEQNEQKMKQDMVIRQKELEANHFIHREFKKNQKMADKAYEEATREHDKQLDIEKMRADLLREREELMNRVNFTKNSMTKVPKNGDGKEFWSITKQ